MQLSLRSMVLAGGLFKLIGFLIVSILNLLLRPYGGAFLVLLASLYPGYDPLNWPLALLIGSIYSLLWGALAGLLFGWLYNRCCARA
ncbi:MAG TPA: hypothetical protein VGA27_06270 [Candidatus Binatia bacterium]